MRITRWLIWIAVAVVVIYVAACAFLFAAQRQFIYFAQGVPGRPESYGLAGFAVALARTDDGLSLLAWTRPAAAGMPTVVVFHGNAGNLSGRARLFSALAAAGFGIVAPEYRGYGMNAGSPSEDGLYRDGRAALALAQSMGVPAGRIILYGESLGTGVAVQIATECACAALALQSPYTSMTDVVRWHMPFVPIDWLLKDRFESIAKIDRVTMPVLVMHGEADVVVPASEGHALYDAARGPKDAAWFQDRGHNDLDPAALVAKLVLFADDHGAVKP